MGYWHGERVSIVHRTLSHYPNVFREALQGLPKRTVQEIQETINQEINSIEMKGQNQHE